MVSTATKVGQFTFSNCLMNAAGVHCMTKEELAEDTAGNSMVDRELVMVDGNMMNGNSMPVKIPYTSKLVVEL